MKQIFLFSLFSALIFLGCPDDGDVPPCECKRPADTTSHNFTWRMDTLGIGNASVLHDVAIVSEDPPLVYAVGEIYLRDSAGRLDIHPYNLAIWNGIEWTYQKVLYHDFGTTELFSGRLNTILAFNANDIFVVSYANLLHWDGNSWTEKAFFMTSIPFDGQVIKMWGTSGSNIYCVGRTGAIYHYTGSSWQKLNSGTTLNINDIYGAQNCKGEWEILAVAGNPSSSYDRKILRINGTSITSLPDQGINYSLSSVWFVPDCHYFAVGSGIYEKNKLSDGQWANGPLDITTFYTTTVRGTAVNNVFVAGAFGELLHFSGSSWKSYRTTATGLSNGSYGSIAIRNKLVIAVGQNSPRAIAAIGRRE